MHADYESAGLRFESPQGQGHHFKHKRNNYLRKALDWEPFRVLGSVSIKCPRDGMKRGRGFPLDEGVSSCAGSREAAGGAASGTGSEITGGGSRGDPFERQRAPAGSRRAAHRQPRVPTDTKLYDRRQDEISLDEVERIAI